MKNSITDKCTYNIFFHRYIALSSGKIIKNFGTRIKGPSSLNDLDGTFTSAQSANREAAL